MPSDPECHFGRHANKASLAFSMYVYLLFGSSGDRAQEMARGLETGRTAVALDEHDPFAHIGLGRMHIVAGEDEAKVALDRARKLKPDLTISFIQQALPITRAKPRAFSGRPGQGRGACLKGDNRYRTGAISVPTKKMLVIQETSGLAWIFHKLRDERPKSAADSRQTVTWVRSILFIREHTQVAV